MICYLVKLSILMWFVKQIFIYHGYIIETFRVYTLKYVQYNASMIGSSEVRILLYMPMYVTRQCPLPYTPDSFKESAVTRT